MRVDGRATVVSWIPSEAVTGVVYRIPFDLSVAHYDDPPPDNAPDDVTAYLAADRARFANRLEAWIEVRDGEVVDFAHTGTGAIGSTSLRLGTRRLTFLACRLPDIRRARPLGRTAVRFEQTAGGRTGLPAPRHVRHAPYAQFAAPLAWSTVALTLHADGRCESELVGASPFPRHWLYDHGGNLVAKTATIDYRNWSATAFGRHSPWGDVDSPAVVSEVESALERQLSLTIMRSGRRPDLRRLGVGEFLTVEGERDEAVFLLLDGVLRVDVGGRALAEVGPGAVLGERALLEGGLRTASLVATTPCLVAVADRDALDEALLAELSGGHRREDEPPATADVSTPA